MLNPGMTQNIQQKPMSFQSTSSNLNSNPLDFSSIYIKDEFDMDAVKEEKKCRENNMAPVSPEYEKTFPIKTEATNILKKQIDEHETLMPLCNLSEEDSVPEFLLSKKRKLTTQNDKSGKKPRKTLTLEIKYEILKLHESGIKVNELAYKFGLAHSTISTILKDKVKYLKEVKSARPMQTTLIRKRDGLIPVMEKLLIMWISDQPQHSHASLDKATISAKARSLFYALKNKHGDSYKQSSFIASKGWFDRFRKRAGWQNVRVQGDTTSANAEPESDFPQQLAKMIKKEGYCSRQVFNVDETELYWKKMPSKTYIAKEENSTPGFQPSKDRMTLLLGANAAGDFKLKPLLVYHIENPRALKGIVKGTLPVIWKTNTKAWVTPTLFEDWFIYHFVPDVQMYCAKNDLPFKALLILDNAPGHPRILQHANPNIKIVFLPPNTTALLQPMDQGVIASFMAYYLQQTFDRLVNAVNEVGGPTLREFWKSFNVLDAVQIIKRAWNAVTEANLKGAWKKLCPELVQDLEDMADPAAEVAGYVVEVAKRLDLEVSPEDVRELLDSHARELLNEDLLEMEEQNVIKEEETIIEPSPPKFTVHRLSEAFKNIESAMKIFETDDPNFERSSKVISTIKNAYACYREIFYEKMATSFQVWDS